MPFDVKLTDISISLSGDDELRGVLAVPDGKGPFPAVVMVHEVFGIDESMRSQITRMASAGYLVLMPDLYSRGGMRKCLKATFRALVDGVGQAYVDVEAAKQLLLSRPDCTGKIGVVGFCMGGGFALQLVSKGYDAAAVNYGQAAKDLDAQLAGSCPIVASFGGGNPTILLVGIILFAVSTLFTIVTLPVEFDASARALKWLDNSHLAVGDEYAKAKDALKWAALTYVVAALASIAMLVQYILIYQNRSRD